MRFSLILLYSDTTTEYNRAPDCESPGVSLDTLRFCSFPRKIYTFKGKSSYKVRSAKYAVLFLLFATAIGLVIVSGEPKSYIKNFIWTSEKPRFSSVLNLEVDECERLSRQKFMLYGDLFVPRVPPLFKSFEIKRCELALVMAGSARTGSTLLTKIIHDSMDRLNRLNGVKYKSIGYWRLQRHLRQPPEKDLETMTNILDGVPNDTQVLILKSHEYDPEVFKLCKKTFVITSTKDVKQTMESIVAAGWLPNNCTKLRNKFNDQLQHFRCWQRHSRLRLVYEDFKTDKRITAMSILSKTAEMLKIPTETLLGQQSILFNFSSEYMHEEANPRIPGKKIDEIVDCRVEGFLDAEFSGTPSLHYL